MTFEDNITSNETLPWLNFTTCFLVALGVIVLDGLPACLLVATYLLANRHNCKKRAAESKDDKHHGDRDEICANCGSKGGNDGGVKLKDCAACRLVKYCGVACQKAHRKQHKKACKERVAELKDEQLYSQGHERPEGDFCPLCTLPIPLPTDKNSVCNVCCMKSICKGCALAADKRGMNDCVFCRTPLPDKDNDADTLAMVMARVEKKDPEAIYHLGQTYFYGKLGLERDMQKAVELYTEAVDLGSVEALYSLGAAHSHGDGVEQDKAKAFEFYRKAAKQGHAEGRHNLGNHEGRKGNHDRAARHFFISASLGLQDSVEMIKKLFMAGIVTKEQYAEALKGYQDAVEATKSHDRDEAKRFEGWKVGK